ncbi:hypothetical protein ACWDTP_23250 [Mycobacterium sp. NPDC003449]
MFKKVAFGFIAAAALSLPLAPMAAAEDGDEEAPNPLSADGLCGCDVPTLSVGGLTGKEQEFKDSPPLSAKGIADRIKVVFGDGRNGGEATGAEDASAEDAG